MRPSYTTFIWTQGDTSASQIPVFHISYLFHSYWHLAILIPLMMKCETYVMLGSPNPLPKQCLNVVFLWFLQVFVGIVDIWMVC
jgi:hypothetical protein